MDIILNPIMISVVVMIVLCLLKVNVFLTITLCSLLCALIGGAGFADGMGYFISGMGNNSEIVFCMLMFGMLSYTMEDTKLGDVLVPRVSRLVGSRIWLLPVVLCLMGAISESFILIYVAFVPIFVPPLLKLFNRYKLDRRMLVTVIMCGLQIGYVCIPAGFGRMFQEIVQGELASNGLEVPFDMVWKSNLVILLALVVGVAAALFFYRKPREYRDAGPAGDETPSGELPKLNRAHIGCILATLAAVVVQLLTDSMPLGAACAIAVLLVSGAVKLRRLEATVMGGLSSMGYVAFVLMAATGFANVCRETGHLDELVSSVAAVTGGSKLICAFVMLLLGLLVTMGIGSAWSTVPIVASVLVPLGVRLGFSSPAIIMMVAAAGALGDSGSPASDQTLVPTAAFNIDGQHDHIRDTCLPSFLCVNIPLLVVCGIAASLM